MMGGFGGSPGEGSQFGSSPPARLLKHKTIKYSLFFFG